MKITETEELISKRKLILLRIYIYGINFRIRRENLMWNWEKNEWKKTSNCHAKFSFMEHNCCKWNQDIAFLKSLLQRVIIYEVKTWAICRQHPNKLLVKDMDFLVGSKKIKSKQKNCKLKIRGIMNVQHKKKDDWDNF